MGPPLPPNSGSDSGSSSSSGSDSSSAAAAAEANAAEAERRADGASASAGGSEDDGSDSSSSSSSSSGSASAPTSTEQHGDLSEAEVSELRSQMSSMRAEAAESGTRFAQAVKEEMTKVDAESKAEISKLEEELHAIVSEAQGKAPEKMKAFNGRLASMHAEISANYGGMVRDRETKRRATLKEEEQKLQQGGAAQITENFEGCAREE